MSGSPSHVSLYQCCFERPPLSPDRFLQGIVGLLLEVLHQWHLSHEQQVQTG